MLTANREISLDSSDWRSITRILADRGTCDGVSAQANTRKVRFIRSPTGRAVFGTAWA